jgi:peptide/nickel transport system permease protein
MRRLFQRIFWRLLAGLGVLWGAITLTFIAINFTPGDPAMTILGGADTAVVSNDVLERVRKDYGLDQPAPVQYFHYLDRVLRGDLGLSYRLHVPVTRVISEQLGASVHLALAATLTAVVFSILLGILTARRGLWIRSLSSGIELTISSMPSFVLGILLLLIFCFRLRWLPAAGGEGWQVMVLPTVTLALPIIAVLTQVLRQEMEDALEKPFILTARARGLSEAGVRLGSALRHALISLLTLSSFMFANLLGGVVIVEALFSRQGVGHLMVEAATNKDVPLVLGITLLAAVIHVIVNLTTDVLYVFVDPRVKATI